MTKLGFFLGGEAEQPEVLIERGLRAADAGFDGLFVSDHFHPWVSVKGTASSVWVVLSSLAALRPAVTLGTFVHCPLWRQHPAVSLQIACSISRVSEAPFFLGLGTGEALNEEPLGFEFPSYSERKTRLTEAVSLMQTLLKEEQTNFQGTYYSLRSAGLFSPPLSSSSFTLAVAAGGPKSAKLAAQTKVGLISSVKDPIRCKDRVLSPYLEAGGAGPRIFSSWTVYGKTETQWAAALTPWQGLRVPDRLHLSDPRQLQAAADRLTNSELISGFKTCRSQGDLLQHYAQVKNGLKPDFLVLAVASEAQIRQDKDWESFLFSAVKDLRD